MKLSLLTYNTLFAGRDGSDDRRAEVQIALIARLRPDIFLMQEAKGFEAGGGVLLHALEARIGMRGFLAAAPHTGQNTAIFVREPLHALAFEADNVHFHHALATLRLALPHSQQPLTVMSAHLCPNGTIVRRREAAYLAVRAAPDDLALLGGDFNSASPHDGEPDGFDRLAPHHRARYLADDLKSVDRTVIAQFEAAGWVDVGQKLDPAATPTVPTSAFPGTEFATMRCDYVMATAAMAADARSYEVIRNTETAIASDHYPIHATFEIPS